MTPRLLLSFLLLYFVNGLLLNCTSSTSASLVVQSPKQTSYENTQFNFQLVLPGQWSIYLDDRAMPPSLKSNRLALQNQGLKVHMMAVPKGSRRFRHGLRITSQHVAMTNREYTEATLKANAADLGPVQYEIRKLAGDEVSYWAGGKGSAKYAEYIMTIDGHNIRLTFWGSKQRWVEREAHAIMQSFTRVKNETKTKPRSQL